jgi:hypothetical protein
MVNKRLSIGITIFLYFPTDVIDFVALFGLIILWIILRHYCIKYGEN